MKSTVGLLTFAIVHCLLFVRVEMADLEKAFKEHEVIPDAITTAPQSLLKVKICWRNSQVFFFFKKL